VPAPRSGRAGRFDWERALRDSDLPTTTKAVCLLLGTYMSPDGGDARPSVSTMCRQLDLTRSTVHEHLARATAAGWLASIEATGRVTVRLATLPDLSGQPDGSHLSGQPDGSDQPDTPVRSAGPHLSGQPDPTSPVTKSEPDQPGAAVLIEPENPPSAPEPDAPYGRTDWRQEWCEEAATIAVRDKLCRDRSEAYELLEALASDAGTSSPRRLTTRMGVDHARRLLRRTGTPSTRPRATTAPRPEWCGHCNQTTRRIEADEDGRDLGKCPSCHPKAATAA
jgi:hypothetical protein